jgi:hypothetical protein
MRFLEQDGTDDSKFVEWLDALLAGVFDQLRPNQLYLLKVDNWFGKKWLGFSGKSLGAVGIRKRDLTIPPFIPSRIVSQEQFVRRGQAKPKHPQIHLYQPSGDNLNRKVEQVAPGATLFWYSGQSKTNGRASVMAYVRSSVGYWPWYVGVECAPRWRIIERVGITSAQLDGLATGQPLPRQSKREPTRLPKLIE